METESRIEEALEYIQNDTQHALKIFDEILKEEQNNINALNGKGSALMKLHNNTEALKVFESSLALEENSSAYLNIGIISKSNGDYKNALKCFDKALEFNPRLSSIVSILKNELYEMLNIESEDLESIYDYSHEANSFIKKALKLKNQGKLWDSLDYFKNAIDKDPSCRNTVNDLIVKVEEEILKEFLFNKTELNDKNTSPNGKKLTKLKNLTYRSITVENNPHKSLSLINKIFEINPNDSDVLNFQGIAYFSLRQYNKSIESFDKCLNINENFVPALFNKGLVLRQSGNLKESLKCFEKALNDSDNYKKVKSYQKEILNKLNQY